VLSTPFFCSKSVASSQGETRGRFLWPALTKKDHENRPQGLDFLDENSSQLPIDTIYLKIYYINYDNDNHFQLERE